MTSYCKSFLRSNPLLNAEQAWKAANGQILLAKDGKLVLNQTRPHRTAIFSVTASNC